MNHIQFKPCIGLNSSTIYETGTNVNVQPISGRRVIMKKTTFVFGLRRINPRHTTSKPPVKIFAFLDLKKIAQSLHNLYMYYISYNYT
jgi:hypothetical protein